MQTTQLVWHTESRKVDSLLPHKKTPRTISKEQKERLKQSLETYGIYWSYGGKTVREHFDATA